MTIEQMSHELANSQQRVEEDRAGGECPGDRMDMAGVAKLMSDRFAYRRLLRSGVERDPDPAVLEALFAEHPHLRGTPMFTYARCSFCGGRAGKIRGAMIEGCDSARICTNCARLIVDELDYCGDGAIEGAAQGCYGGSGSSDENE